MKDTSGRCDACNKMKPIVVKGYCLDCWPEQRRFNKIQAQGVEDAKAGKDRNPYSQETDYNAFFAYELGRNYKETMGEDEE